MENLDIQRVLERVARDGYSPDKIPDPYEFAVENLKLLGSLDPYLRDVLFSETLSAWIEEGVFNRQQLKSIWNRLRSDDFLFHEIADPKSVSVYKRTFSILIITAILNRFNSTGELSLLEYCEFRDVVDRYVREERNVLGFSEQHGWAHTPAHTADALKALIGNPYFSAVDLQMVLLCIETLLFKNSKAYIHQEDKRFARVLQALYRRDSRYGYHILSFLNRLSDENPISYSNMDSYHKATNLLALLKSYYFHLRYDNPEEAMLLDLEAQIGRMMVVPRRQKEEAEAENYTKGSQNKIPVAIVNRIENRGLV